MLSTPTSFLGQLIDSTSRLHAHSHGHASEYLVARPLDLHHLAMWKNMSELTTQSIVNHILCLFSEEEGIRDSNEVEVLAISEVLRIFSRSFHGRLIVESDSYNVIS